VTYGRRAAIITFTDKNVFAGLASTLVGAGLGWWCDAVTECLQLRAASDECRSAVVHATTTPISHLDNDHDDSTATAERVGQHGTVVRTRTETTRYQ